MCSVSVTAAGWNLTRSTARLDSLSETDSVESTCWVIVKPSPSSQTHRSPHVQMTTLRRPSPESLEKIGASSSLPKVGHCCYQVVDRGLQEIADLLNADVYSLIAAYGTHRNYRPCPRVHPQSMLRKVHGSVYRTIPVPEGCVIQTTRLDQVGLE